MTPTDMRNTIDLANRDGDRRRRISRTPIALILLGVLVFLGMFAPSLFADARLFLAQYGDDRYAFYLDSGHVFYGKIAGVGLGQIIIMNTYSFQELSVGETSTNNLAAVKDNPLTRPDNWMVINREHLLFYERIGEDASVQNALRAQ